MYKPELHGNVSTQLQATQGEWFDELQQAALAGLCDGVTIDDLEHWLNDTRMRQDAMDAAARFSVAALPRL